MATELNRRMSLGNQFQTFGALPALDYWLTCHTNPFTARNNRPPLFRSSRFVPCTSICYSSPSHWKFTFKFPSLHEGLPRCSTMAGLDPPTGVSLRLHLLNLVLFVSYKCSLCIPSLNKRTFFKNVHLQSFFFPVN